MPSYGPVRRRELIVFLRRLGFDGPYAGRKHQFMTRARTKVRLPNPHRGDLTANLLGRLLQEAGVSREEWESL